MVPRQIMFRNSVHQLGLPLSLPSSSVLPFLLTVRFIPLVFTDHHVCTGQCTGLGGYEGKPSGTRGIPVRVQHRHLRNHEAAAVIGAARRTGVGGGGKVHRRYELGHRTFILEECQRIVLVWYTQSLCYHID